MGVESPTDVMMELQESSAVSRAAALTGCSAAARRLIQSDEAGESPPERSLHKKTYMGQCCHVEGAATTVETPLLSSVDKVEAPCSSSVFN